MKKGGFAAFFHGMPGCRGNIDPGKSSLTRSREERQGKAGTYFLAEFASSRDEQRY
jgi:hypothetical protein